MFTLAASFSFLPAPFSSLHPPSFSFTLLFPLSQLPTLSLSMSLLFCLPVSLLLCLSQPLQITVDWSPTVTPGKDLGGHWFSAGTTVTAINLSEDSEPRHCVYMCVWWGAEIDLWGRHIDCVCSLYTPEDQMQSRGEKKNEECDSKWGHLPFFTS